MSSTLNNKRALEQILGLVNLLSPALEPAAKQQRGLVSTLFLKREKGTDDWTNTSPLEVQRVVDLPNITHYKVESRNLWIRFESTDAAAKAKRILASVQGFETMFAKRDIAQD